MNILPRSGSALVSLVTVSCAAGTACAAAAQPALDPRAGSIVFSGAFEEYRVPNLLGSVFRFTVYGADGGDAGAGNGPNGSVECFQAGGQGATAEMDILIAHQINAFAPGRLIRFVVGEAGETELDDRPGVSGVSGGGGGSALLYDTVGNGSGFQPIAVAGGGGGTYSQVSLGFCSNGGGTGGNGQTIPDGGDSPPGGTQVDPNSGGTNGFAGASSFSDGNIFSGGGGGWRGRATTEAGGGAGGVTGGTGGTTEGARAGGFGFGGGGAGRTGAGGGGGYSGGAAGPPSNRAGGGGSFTNDAFAFGTNTIVGGSPVGENGRIDYNVVAQAHDQREDALPILFDEQGVTTIQGTTSGASVSVLDGAREFGPDVWYSYSNTQDCSENVRLEWPSSQETSVTLLIENETLFRTAGPLFVSIEPGQTIELRVASGSDMFSIDADIVTLDIDGDGVCDTDDICPGGDDTVDTDADGVPDGCDICPGTDDSVDADGDLVPDGCDLCPGNDDLLDTDGNGIGDCTEDCDNDGIPNGLDEPFTRFLTDFSLGVIGDASQTVRFSTCLESSVDTVLAVWTQDGTLIASKNDNAPGCAAGENELSLQLAAGSYFVGGSGGSAVFGETGFEASYDPTQCPIDAFLRVTIRDGDGFVTTRGGTIFARELYRIPFEITEVALPCPADVNNDGELNGADFNAWLNAFSTGDPAADQNGDGNLDGADFNAWLANFAAGCPE